MEGSPGEPQMMGGPPRGGTAHGWDMFACCIPFLKVLGKVSSRLHGPLSTRA